MRGFVLASHNTAPNVRFTFMVFHHSETPIEPVKRLCWGLFYHFWAFLYPKCDCIRLFPPRRRIYGGRSLPSLTLSIRIVLGILCCIRNNIAARGKIERVGSIIPVSSLIGPKKRRSGRGLPECGTVRSCRRWEDTRERWRSYKAPDYKLIRTKFQQRY